MLIAHARSNVCFDVFQLTERPLSSDKSPGSMQRIVTRTLVTEKARNVKDRIIIKSYILLLLVY